MAAQCLALLLHSKRVLGCVEFTCSLDEVFLQVLWLPPTIQRHAGMLDCSKLSVGVNVSVNGCFSLYVSPVMNWRLIQSAPRPSTNVTWNLLEHR